jgi:hypothetical protein
VAAQEPPPRARDAAEVSAEQHRQAAEVHRQATEVAQATRQRAAENFEVARAKYGVTVVLAGLGGTLVAFGLALLAFDTASAVSAALAPITGVLGTIVGAYFGVQVGASGKAESEAARTKAEDDAKKLAAVAPPEAGLAALGVQLPRPSPTQPPIAEPPVGRNPGTTAT